MRKSILVLFVMFLTNNSYTQENLDLNSKLGFTRNDGPSYIFNTNAGGYLNFVTNGRSTSDVNSNLILRSNLTSEFNGDVLMNGAKLSFSRSTGPTYIRTINSGGYLNFVTNGRSTSDANSNLILRSNLTSEFNGDVLMNGAKLSFSRSTGPTYIRTINSGGYLNFVTNGRSTSDANSNLILRSDLTSEFNGNVAILGKLEAKEVKVTLSPTADFVFDDNYELRDLSKVEEYILENKHLPEIPSADEIVNNGVDLATMNSKLLQKIEELTLYMIEMNKRMNSLETENSELLMKLKPVQ